MYLSYAYVIKSKVNTLKVKCHTAISYQFQQSTCDKHSFHLYIHVVDNIYVEQAGILKAKLVLLHACVF